MKNRQNDLKRKEKRREYKREYAVKYRREHQEELKAKQRLRRIIRPIEQQEYDAEKTLAERRRLAHMFPGSVGSNWWTADEDAVVMRTDIGVREMCRILELNGTPRSYRGVEARRYKLLRGMHLGQPLKKRSADRRGELNTSAKLTDAEVLEIRASDLTQDILASMYGVSQPMISAIKRRKCWTHLP